jgi:hypothetical protein
VPFTERWMPPVTKPGVSPLLLCLTKPRCPRSSTVFGPPNIISSQPWPSRTMSGSFIAGHQSSFCLCGAAASLCTAFLETAERAHRVCLHPGDVRHRSSCLMPQCMRLRAVYLAWAEE